MDELKNYLLIYASRDLLHEDGDENPYEASGGNYDDCFNLGIEDGEIYLARAILKKFFPEESENG